MKCTGSLSIFIRSQLMHSSILHTLLCHFKTLYLHYQYYCTLYMNAWGNLASLGCWSLLCLCCRLPGGCVERHRGNSADAPPSLFLISASTTLVSCQCRLTHLITLRHAYEFVCHGYEMVMKTHQITNKQGSKSHTTIKPDEVFKCLLPNYFSCSSIWCEEA